VAENSFIQGLDLKLILLLGLSAIILILLYMTWTLGSELRGIKLEGAAFRREFKEAYLNTLLNLC
jgi:hypothetical protein